MFCFGKYCWMNPRFSSTSHEKIAAGEGAKVVRSGWVEVVLFVTYWNVQGIKVRASYILGKHSTIDLYSQPMEVLYVGKQTGVGTPPFLRVLLNTLVHQIPFYFSVWSYDAVIHNFLVFSVLFLSVFWFSI